ncbi:hypothetical protein Desku_0750 [Desulfofundulus kuznetsovii DSM 6115]|uniref:Uncharacterized protein n=1 Tax=Desulfofundulus kuznetsovii (strain DSM 6115 / VKM B-1805 / 17) TaxID=760568 RepID=A0AAU8P991_DESK7|nr:hypothetical protein Desku_0750 [Desulfofundulus kuznetsovii DSM 6115]
MSKRKKKNTEIPLLHVYGQHAWHDDVYIVGNKQGLEMLLAVAKQALKEDRGETGGDVFTADGEGYSVIVLFRDDSWPEGWNRVALPYWGDHARDKREDVLWPEDL